jgi:hypothetical protein
MQGAFCSVRQEKRVLRRALQGFYGFAVKAKRKCGTRSEVRARHTKKAPEGAFF